MALPVIKSAAECANFYSTVEPYYQQLTALPQVVVESITSLAALKQIYIDTNPVASAVAFSTALGPIFLVAAEINKNYSQVDRFWSILPTVYNVHFALYAYVSGVYSPRTAAVAALSTIWSTRLTYNYWRKGGYTVGSEDYRWPIIRQYVGAPIFFLFNITFISFAQSWLLTTITLPSYILLLKDRLANFGGAAQWDIGDTVAASTILGLIMFTYVADQQQWNFQTAKHQYRKTAKVPHGYTQAELDRGFLTKNLFAYSRHPNFLGEQSIWVTLYLWGCYASGTLYNYTGVGAACYLVLFQASTWLTELLSSQKYPAYAQYQKNVGKFLPFFGRGEMLFKDSIGKQLENAKVEHEKEEDAAHARERYDLR